MCSIRNVISLSLPRKCCKVLKYRPHILSYIAVCLEDRLVGDVQELRLKYVDLSTFD